MQSIRRLYEARRDGFKLEGCCSAVELHPLFFNRPVASDQTAWRGFPALAIPAARLIPLGASHRNLEGPSQSAARPRQRLLADPRAFRFERRRFARSSAGRQSKSAKLCGAPDRPRKTFRPLGVETMSPLTSVSSLSSNSIGSAAAAGVGEHSNRFAAMHASQSA